jgi:ribokinase
VICTLGDLLLDVIVRLDAPIAEDTDTYGRTRVGAGGQAANVAAWVAALGGRSRFLGKRARDAVGRLVADELTQRGVIVLGPEVARGTGTVVSVTMPDGTRTMLSDRGVAPMFAPSELEEEWLGECETLHVPGYSLAREPLCSTTHAAGGLAPRRTLDLSSTRAIESIGAERFRERLARLGPDLVFATQAEADLVGPLDVGTLVVKLGAEGCVVRRDDGERRYAAAAAEVVDSTGAGDAFAAGFLVGGPELALEAAARCVATMGAMPP